MKSSNQATSQIFIDGGARGNPGPAGAGVLIQDDREKTLFAGGFFLGRLTNNQAEYRGLLLALEIIDHAEIQHVRIYSDSELLVRQLNGQYKVKSPGLKPLFQQVSERLNRLSSYEINHVYREKNAIADRLANKAMDAVRDVLEVDALGWSKANQRAMVSAAPGPSAQTGRSRDGHFSDAATAGVAVEARVVRGCRKGGCDVQHQVGENFVFTSVVPAGLCVEACSALIDTVQAIRSALAAGQSLPDATTVSCQKMGCGAIFQVAPVEQ